MEEVRVLVYSVFAIIFVLIVACKKVKRDEDE